MDAIERSLDEEQIGKVPLNALNLDMSSSKLGLEAKSA